MNAPYNRVGCVALVEDASGAVEYYYGKMGEVTINDDSSSVYNPLEIFYSASEMKNIPIRYYVKKENYIIDCTFNYYYPNDSCTLYFWYPDPLFKRKIKQNKEEKNLIYSRKTIDRIW